MKCIQAFFVEFTPMNFNLIINILNNNHYNSTTKFDGLYVFKIYIFIILSAYILEELYHSILTYFDHIQN